MTAVTMLLAWAIEAAAGWPKGLYRRIRHPVVWIGWLIVRLDLAFNRERLGDGWRTLAGALAATMIVLATWAVATAVTTLLPDGPLGIVVEALIAASLLASRSLYEHVSAVSESLAADSIATAREAVSHIVGRDPEGLDEAGIARAALESLAENASDGCRRSPVLGRAAGAARHRRLQGGQHARLDGWSPQRTLRAIRQVRGARG